MLAAINNFSQAHYANKVLMLGAMWELGAESIYEHQEILKRIEQNTWNAVVLVGGDFGKIQHPHNFFNTSKEAAAWLAQQAFQNTAILVKGSRATAMENVLSLTIL
jgi:UDP-N-acetylmuramoyl-tripeptide--D-alanyl-D-alanine ligase